MNDAKDLRSKLDAMVHLQGTAYDYELPIDVQPRPSNLHAGDLYCCAYEIALALLQRIDELEGVIRWALGEEGDFPDRPEKVEGKTQPLYWWRTELRSRAALAASSPIPGSAEVE